MQSSQIFDNFWYSLEDLQLCFCTQAGVFGHSHVCVCNGGSSKWDFPLRWNNVKGHSQICNCQGMLKQHLIKSLLYICIFKYLLDTRTAYMTSHRLWIQFYINDFLTTLSTRQSSTVLGYTWFRTQSLPDCHSELQETALFNFLMTS